MYADDPNLNQLYLAPELESSFMVSNVLWKFYAGKAFEDISSIIILWLLHLKQFKHNNNNIIVQISC